MAIQGKNAAIIFRVCTWDDLATLLINSFRCSDLIYEFARDVLRRCRGQSPLKVSDLKDSSKVLAQRLQQRELLEKIRDRLQDEPLFKGMQFPLERKPEWDKEHCYMGITIAPPNALSEKDWVGWIGFWNLFQRKNDLETPLFAHVSDTELAKSLLPKFWLSLKTLQAANTVAPYVDGHGWPVLIPIRILEECKSVQEQAEKIVAYSVRVFNGGPIG